ncbi:MAG: hypothetical protein R3D57_01820 [Hyphomicrobiaceae bacterium]
MRGVLQWVGVVALVACLGSAADAYQASDDVNQRELLTDKVATTIRAGDTFQLGALSMSYVLQSARLHGGAWHLTTFYDAFARVVHEAVDAEELAELDRLTERWMSESEMRAAPVLARATVLLESAARESTDGTIGPSTIARVRELLAKNEAKLARDPHYFAILVRLAALENADFESMKPILREAIRSEPAYFLPHLMAAEHVMFRTTNTGASLEEFAQFVRDEAGADQGNVLYARIYQHAMVTLYGADLFKASKADWLILKHGIARIMERYPASGLNRNHFALMACLKGDRDIAGPLFREIHQLGAQPPSWIWGDTKFFDACSGWAAGEPALGEPLQLASPLIIQGSARLLSSDTRKRFTATYERAIRERLKGELQSLLFSSSFDGLERTATKYRSQELRTPSGLPMLGLMYDGFHNIVTTGLAETDDHLRRQLQSYLTEYPQSPTAVILNASFMVREAWATRKKDASGKVTMLSNALAIEKAERAVRFLEAHQEVGKKDPAWFSVMLGLGRMLHWPPEKSDLLVAEGAKLYPRHYSIYFGGAYFHLYSDGQLNGNLEPYARWAMTLVRPEDREAIYARIYWYAEQKFLSYSILQYTAASWPDLRRGFDAMIETYPSAWNENAYAYFSCLAGDAAKLRELLPKVEGYNEDPPWEIWQTPPLLDSCLEFARSAPVDSNPAPDASPEQNPT